MSLTHSATAPIHSPARFDNLAFAKYVKDIGREYRKQATELVFISRRFAQAQEQTRSSYEELESTLQVVDDALYSAKEARKKTTMVADAKFNEATVALSAYEKKYHHMETVTQMMTDAKARDISSSTFLKSLKEAWRPLKKGKTIIVQFLLHKLLPDKNPTIVKQELSQHSNTKEILWNFSRFEGEKRVTLKDNPHFYDNLPTSAEEYKGRFRTYPIETFQQEKISVLIDRPRPAGRLFLETAKKKRVFGNAWVPKEAIIFKDVCGKLEGEKIVSSAIENTPNLWCFEESPLSDAPTQSLPSPTTIMSPTTSPTGALLEDWREPILRMLHSQDAKINIRISDKLPNNYSSGYSGPSLPSPLEPRSIAGSLSQIELQSRPTLGIQIPGASQGPLSPSSYKTARSTPVIPQPQTVELLPESPPSPAPISPTPARNTAPPTGPAVPDPITLPPLLPPHASRVDLIPSQADTATILPMPTTTADPLGGQAVPDSPICLLPDTSLPVGPIPSQEGGTATIFQSHTIELHAENNRLKAPTRPVMHFGPGITTNLDGGLASGLFSQPQPQQRPVVPPPPKQKKHWYQKCVDVIKNALRH